MSGIEVHDNVLHVQGLDGVFGERLVGIGGLRALGDVQVSHKVGQAVGLDDEDEGDIGERLDLGGDVIDVSLVEGSTVVGKGELAVRSQSCAVTLWEIVYDKGQDQVGTGGVLLLNVFRESGDGGHFGAYIPGSD